MPRLIVFMPKKLKFSDNVDIYGDIEIYGEVIVFYFLHTGEDNCHKKKIIGILTNNNGSCGTEEYRNFVQICFINGKYEIVHIKVRNEDVTLTISGVPLLVLYDKSDFFSGKQKTSNSKVLTNYFKILEGKLLECSLEPAVSNRLITFLSFFLSLLTAIERVSQRLMPVIKYSAIGLHVTLILNRGKWVVKDIIDNRCISIKSGNVILAVILDISLGIFCLSSITAWTSIEEFPQIFLWTAEYVVFSLRSLLDWLVGSPAGFKLNFAFNNILKQFYVFHTEIWWLFLASLSPGLGVVFNIFTILGQLGITVQAAILSDLLGLVSFHIYCIYAYAARLYNLQLAGLVSLWRLFLGRKKNPLRGKVDSCQYSADQLFVGTLLFTIALFLLPTTLLYYVVFTSFRLVLVGIGGLLTKLRKYLHALPIFSTILWSFGSRRVFSEVRMEPDFKLSSPDITVVRVKRTPPDFKTTILKFVPDCIESTEKSSGGITGFFSQLIQGDLLYPV